MLESLTQFMMMTDTDSVTCGNLNTTMDTCQQMMRSPPAEDKKENIAGNKGASGDIKQNQTFAGGRDSDTESMEPETGVEPDSLVFSLPIYEPGSATPSDSLPKACPDPPSPAPAASVIMGSYEHFLHSANTFFQTSMDRVSELEQENEVLRLKEKDLRSQVKQLKEENFHLKMVQSQVGRLNVNELLQNLRQAVERMHEYKHKCEALAAQLGMEPDAQPDHSGLGSIDSDCTVEPDTLPDSLVMGQLESTEERTLTQSLCTGYHLDECIKHKAPEYNLVTEDHARFLGKFLDCQQTKSLLDSLHKLHEMPSHDALARGEDAGPSDHVASEAIITWVRQAISMVTTENLVKAMCRASLRPEAEEFCKEFGFDYSLKAEVDEA